MAANPEMGRLISEGMRKARAARHARAAQEAQVAAAAAGHIEAPVSALAPPSRPSEGVYDDVNRQVIADMIRARRQAPRSSAYWCTCMRDELGNALIDLTALLDQIPELSGEPLPPYGEQLRVALVGFMEVGFGLGFHRRGMQA